MEQNRVVLMDEDTGKEFEFEVIDLLEIDEEEYAILLPIEEENENDEAIILKIGLDENGAEILFEIENDDEWEMVAQVWRETRSENNTLQ